MPPRRSHEREDELDFETRILIRRVTERDVVSFAVLLLTLVDDAWHTVVLYDCSHSDRNDRHRYAVDGTKGVAEVFHRGTPSEAMREAIALIKTDYRGIIERWRA